MSKAYLNNNPNRDLIKMCIALILALVWVFIFG